MAEAQKDVGSGEAPAIDVEDADPTEIYQLIGQLGEGAYGSVWHAKHKVSGEEYAVKVLQIDTDFEDVRREIEFMKSTRHPNVCQYFGSYYIDPDLWIVMEYCAGGSCADMMRVCRRPFNEQMVSTVIRDTLSGLAYIHSLRKIHRDIKAGNILVNNRGEAKIADFGVSGELTGTMSRMNTVIGSPFWMAPEVIMEVGYSSKVDVWSLGITCIELAETLPPLAEIHPMRAIFLIPSRPPPTFTDPSKWSRAFNEFLERCLQKDPMQRASAEELLQDSFISNAASNTCMLRMLDEQAQVIRQLGRAEALGLGEEYIEDSIASQSRFAMVDAVGGTADTFVEKSMVQEPLQPASIGSPSQSSGVPAPATAEDEDHLAEKDFEGMTASGTGTMIINQVSEEKHSWQSAEKPSQEAASKTANATGTEEFKAPLLGTAAARDREARQRKRRTMSFNTPSAFLSKRQSVRYEKTMMQQIQAAQQAGGFEMEDTDLSEKAATSTAKKAEEQKIEPASSGECMPKVQTDQRQSIEAIAKENIQMKLEIESMRALVEQATRERMEMRRKYFCSLVLSIKLEAELRGWPCRATQTASDLWDTVDAETISEDLWREWIMRALTPDHFAAIDARRANAVPN